MSKHSKPLYFYRLSGRVLPGCDGGVPILGSTGFVGGVPGFVGIVEGLPMLGSIGCLSVPMFGSFVLPGGLPGLGSFGRVPGFVGIVEGLPMLGSIGFVEGLPMFGFVGGVLILGSLGCPDGLSIVGATGFVLLESLVLVFFRIARGLADFFFFRVRLVAIVTFDAGENVC